MILKHFASTVALDFYDQSELEDYNKEEYIGDESNNEEEDIEMEEDIDF